LNAQKAEGETNMLNPEQEIVRNELSQKLRPHEVEYLK